MCGWSRTQLMNAKAPRNENLNERFYKDEVDPWYAVKRGSTRYFSQQQTV